jgi:hypothetical protein
MQEMYKWKFSAKIFFDPNSNINLFNQNLNINNVFHRLFIHTFYAHFLQSTQGSIQYAVLTHN